jgi:hypothetical protein
MAEWGGGKSEVGCSFLSDVRSSARGTNPRGRRRPAATGAEHSLHGECGHQEQGGVWDRATVPGGQKEMGRQHVGPAR